MDHAVTDGKVSDGLAFYDCIAFDELWCRPASSAPEDREETSRIDLGQQGAG